jgi:preprotein translocase subunit SecD
MNKTIATFLFSALLTMALCPLESLFTGMSFSEEATVVQEPGIRIILAVDLPDDAYTQDDLQETADNISRRINALGLTEATVKIQGENHILVEITGLEEKQLVIDTIQQTGLLEFVDFSGIPSEDVRSLVGEHILTTAQMEHYGNQEQAPDYLLHPGTGEPFTTILTGHGLQSAVPAYNDMIATWQISFELTEEGGEIFGPYTASHIGEALAIVLDGKILSAPTLQTELTTGAVITGQFTEDEAKTLALQLNSGALPIPLIVESVEEIGE